MRKLMLSLVIFGAALATLAATPTKANAWFRRWGAGYYAYPAYYYSPGAYSSYYYSYPAYYTPAYSSYYYRPAVRSYYYTPAYSSYYTPAYSSYYTPAYSSYYYAPGAYYWP